jgi:phospholipase/carboxylesterase
MAAPKLLDGPRRGAAPGDARQLVVILHGYGASGDDLIPLADVWRPLLPDAAFVAPHAPEPCRDAPMGRQWFTLRTRSPEERWAGAVAAAPTLDAFLDAELASFGLDDSKLMLVGFSQGTMMALHVGLRRPRPPAGILGYSGLLVGPERLAARGDTLPVFLVHGDQDGVVPVEALFQAVEAMAAVGIASQWHVCEGLDHMIDDAGLALGGRFIVEALTGR